MKKKYFLLIISIICYSSLFGQISKKVAIRQSNIQVEKIDDYDRITIDNTIHFTQNIGEPELPITVRSFVIPREAQLNGITVKNLNKQKLAGNYLIYPAQPPLPVSNQDSVINFTLPNPAIYQSSKAYPGKQAEIISDDLYLGYRIISVRLYPLEYNPLTQEVYLCNFDFTLDYSATVNQTKSVKYTTQAQSAYRHELNKRNVRFIVDNPEEVDNYDTGVKKIIQGKTSLFNNEVSLRSQTIPVTNEQVPDYIIITNEELKSAWQTLVDWKTKKGIFTIITTTEEIETSYFGSDLQEKVRNYLLQAYEQWGSGLYVLLGGDINIVPSRFIDGVNDDLFYPSDRYYSTLDSWNIYKRNIFYGNDSKSIINLLGRIPVSSAQEVAIYTKKIIAYEKADNIGNLSYLKNNLYADAYMKDNGLGGLINSFHKPIKNSISAYVPQSINRKFICDNADCLGDSNYYTYWDSQYTFDCSSGNIINGDIELNRNNFLSCLNTGANLGLGKFHFIYHIDHSSVTSIGLSSKAKGERITAVDVDALTNGSSYQILFSGGCNPANFTYDCFGKHYIMNPNGGGVAFIGNTDSGYQYEFDQIAFFSDAIYTTSGYPSLGRYDIASAFQNICVHNSYSSIWRLHLLGDPEMQIWTDVPQMMGVSLSSTSIQAGQRSIGITLSNLNLPAGEKALICIQKETEVYQTQTVDSNGTYTFAVAPETIGTMHVTVTAHNYFPVEKTIQVTTCNTENPIITSVDFIDDGSNNSIGNGNEMNDAGETIRLQVNIKNNGRTIANNLTAKLSSTSGYIDILNDSYTLGSVSAMADTNAYFLYQINKDTPETVANQSGNPIQFKLELTDSSNTLWTRSFNIDVFAPDLQLRNKISINAIGNVVDFNVELQNMGSATATGLSAVLTAANSTNSVTRTYPTIAQFETKAATSNFQFTLPSGSTTTNTQFALNVSNAYGRTWSFPFTLQKPPAVGGVNFIAGEQVISFSWNNVSGASGYNIYRCDVDSNDMELGTYVKLNTLPVTYNFFEDKYNLSPLTKYLYKIAAVSTTGMEGDLFRILAWTSYPTKGMFPIQMETSKTTDRFLSSAIADDINNDGYPEFFTAITNGDNAQAGYLVALDKDGMEPFDIDNNVTTYSGFAEFNASMQAPVAIGDLFATGEKYIISVSRDMSNYRTNYVSCHSYTDNDFDGRPDLVWQNSTYNSHIKGAIITNLDNSSDNSMEIIVKTDGNSCGNWADGNKISILDNNGNLLNTLSSVGGDCNYAAIAAADLDGDGDKEIIAGYSDGVYIWHHDGTPYSTNPVFTNSNYQFNSSPIVCDLDNDGQKEIIIAAPKSASQSTVFAFKPDGTLLSGWGTNVQTYSTSGSSQEISVGDLYDNGILYVVAVGDGVVSVWDKLGTPISSTILAGVLGNLTAPILADVDEDNIVEIIVTSKQGGNLYAIKPDGQFVLGFPLQVDEKFARMSPCVVDLDKNGKSEIIAATGKKVYVWEVNGNPDRIEWGYERHDPQNTGEYFSICPKTLILSDTVWNSDKEVCNDIIVESGTLTLNSSCILSLNGSSMIIVRPGANLVVDGGSVLNAHVKALPGSSIKIKDNGHIKLRRSGDFKISLGAISDCSQGRIEITE